MCEHVCENVMFYVSYYVLTIELLYIMQRNTHQYVGYNLKNGCNFFVTIFKQAYILDFRIIEQKFRLDSLSISKEKRNYGFCVYWILGKLVHAYFVLFSREHCHTINERINLQYIKCLRLLFHIESQLEWYIIDSWTAGSSCLLWNILHHTSFQLIFS